PDRLFLVDDGADEGRVGGVGRQLEVALQVRQRLVAQAEAVVALADLALGLGVARIGARRLEILGERAVDVAAAEQRLALGERALGRRRRLDRGRDGPRFGRRRPRRPRRDRRRARGSRVTAAAVVFVVLLRRRGRRWRR